MNQKRADQGDTNPTGAIAPHGLTHLQRLEAESIHILREAVAESENPVVLYSIGKDSSVTVHLARKAFHPSAPPFPLLHVDTTWKFQAMYEFRDKMVADFRMELLVHQNPDCVEQGINPFTHGSAVHTDMWKTEGLKQARCWQRALIRLHRSPWLRPTNENFNRLLRRYVGKRTDLSVYSQQDLDRISHRINTMPRRIHHRESAARRYAAGVVALTAGTRQPFFASDGSRPA